MITTIDQQVSLILDHADFCGIQEWGDGLPAIELWTLRKPIPGHPKGSTICRQTLIEYLLSPRRELSLPTRGEIASDTAAEVRGEGRTLRAGRANIHE